MNLEDKKRYLNSGNIFAKSILIKDYIKTKNKANIITDQKNIKLYSDILNYLGVKINILDNVSDLVNLLYNKNTSYIIDKNIFNFEMSNIYTLNNKQSIKIEKNSYLEVDDFIKKLNDLGYKHSDYLEGGDFKKMGDIVQVKLPKDNNTILISFFGDSIEEIIYDDNKGTQNKIENIIIGQNKHIDIIDNLTDINIELIEEINKNKPNVIVDNLDITKLGNKLDIIENGIFFDALKNINHKQTNLGISDLYIENIDILRDIIKSNKVEIYTKNKQTINNFLEYNNLGITSIHETKLTNLKSHKTLDKIIICDDNLSKIFTKKRLKKNVSQNLDLLLQIKPGDYIVHIDHGVGVFEGVVKKELSKITKEYIQINYLGNDSLYVPITEINRVSKYIGKENPTLTKLSGNEWTKKLQKAGEDASQVAEELLEIYARKKLLKSNPIFVDKLIVDKFQNSFDYEYTKDQENAINEILEDMSKDTPMDRILIGDVGFGKTEVAFNAIYAAIKNKKQVALISPLVVLAYEHYSKALDRFTGEGINIEVLTRMEKPSKIKQVLAGLKSGKIDLVVGTHKLLGKEVIYKDLGLLVIDEEHKFGVKEKEKINEIAGRSEVKNKNSKELEDFSCKTSSEENCQKCVEVGGKSTNANELYQGGQIENGKKLGNFSCKTSSAEKLYENIQCLSNGVLNEKDSISFNFPHVLSMSATPIPRSLNMALNGIKGVSILSNPPVGRKAIETYVSEHSDSIILDAAKKEFDRGGQVFFIHNRVTTIENFGKYLSSLFPDKKIIITHGQLSGDELENRILDFKYKKYDILLSSTVIENGIDFPNVNTIFINDAYKFGISQIHQLRGRVGRSDRSGHCYLLFNKEKLNLDAAKRLQTIVEYSHLGAGFELSMKDLEIRGGGDILGIKQSGISSDIGINTFLKLLEDKIEELKAKKENIKVKKKLIDTKIDLNIGAYLDDSLFENEIDKLNFYREIESLETIEELEELIEDFGADKKDLGIENKNFFDLLRYKIKASELNISNIKRVGINYQVEFFEGNTVDNLKDFLKKDSKVYFSVVDLTRVRTSVNNFKKDIELLEYLFSNDKKRKIKLKK